MNIAGQRQQLNLSAKGLKAYYHRQKQLEKAREREAVKQAKERAKFAIERSKIQAKEAAAAEVEAFEEGLADLQGLHKTCSVEVDWKSVISLVNPHPPIKSFRRGLRLDLARLTEPDYQDATSSPSDETTYQDAVKLYVSKREEVEDLRAMAEGVLEKDLEAYGTVLEAYTPFYAVEQLGSEVTVSWGDHTCAALSIMLPGRSVVPEEIKSLSAGGKVTVKAMPRTQAQEIYHDFICSCVLRIAREIFAWLPLNAVVITIQVKDRNTATGQNEEVTVFSGAFPREQFKCLDFQNLDPSDSMENFKHRGDLKVSRRTGTFVSVVPFNIEDYRTSNPKLIDLEVFKERIQNMGRQLNAVFGGKIPESNSEDLNREMQ